MTAVISIHCRKCGAALRDKFSRTLGYGPECRKDMTPDQLADALRANQPGYIPKATPRPASPQARRNHAEVTRVTAPTPTAKRCTHDGIPGACPLCRHEADPWHCADRIITLTVRQPMADRLETQRAAARRRWAAYLPAPEPDQLTIGA